MDLESQSDEWLMGQVAKGSRDSLSILVNRYSTSMLSFLRRFLNDGHLAEELFQEVFLTVWSKRKQYRFPATFRSWLFTIGANKCREHYRRQKRQVVSDDVAAALVDRSTSSGPIMNAIQSETKAAINVALQQLPDSQRQVVVMRLWNQLSYAEIAIAIGAKEGNVRAMMHRALAKLRPALDQLASS